MDEKEIVVDLSGKIKIFGYYISVGTLLLSGIVMLIQILIFLSNNDWVFDPIVFTVMLDFVLALRGEKNNKKNNKKSD